MRKSPAIVTSQPPRHTASSIAAPASDFVAVRARARESRRAGQPASSITVIVAVATHRAGRWPGTSPTSPHAAGRCG
ncbi:MULTISPECIES: hypothetical protein [Ralstonia]|uniref:Uncharacterized protein n=1 Tax=Ralstonia pickettii TaxID=329 RepID=A0AAW4QB04_RALPI|nr:hypothetical protein [Ralstonia pickettii]UNK04254.1 hypothetical protein MMB19_30335 [Ralstonia insidiosa]MBX3756364.1 hypothetical protein [Ralstonia pickettii]MBX3785865.1 hypothetical protein [Ralstonia pickettii]MBX3790582.1 hypothetical protein [Ralstonia pickettii]MBX3795558.1 hypothetical protein [Ralstonia pickettii]